MRDGRSPTKSIRKSAERAGRKSKGERTKKSHQRGASSSGMGKYAPVENPSAAARTDQSCVSAHDANAPRETIRGYKRASAEIEFALSARAVRGRAHQCSRLRSRRCNVHQVAQAWPRCRLEQLATLRLRLPIR